LAESQSSEDLIVCPMCGTDVSKDAIECPICGEPFSPEAILESEKSMEKANKGSKLLFWLGLILVIIGGPGVALGSWLHDFLNISIAGYDNFESFGWANRLVSIVGIIILVVGIVFLILSLSKMEKEVLEDIEVKEGPEESSEQGG